jgi:hypothetical protein
MSHQHTQHTKKARKVRKLFSPFLHTTYKQKEIARIVLSLEEYYEDLGDPHINYFFGYYWEE